MIRSNAFSQFPAFFALVVALVVSLPVLRNWMPPLVDRLPGKSKHIIPDPTVKVWINNRSGFYYCAESALFGKIAPGAYMLQDLALEKGYQPAKTPCRQSSQSQLVRGGSPPPSPDRHRKAHPSPAVEARIKSSSRDENTPSHSSNTAKTTTATLPAGETVEDSDKAGEEFAYKADRIRR